MNTVQQWLQNEGLTILFIIIGAVVLYCVGSYLIRFIAKHAIRNKHRTAHKKDIEKRQKTVISLSLNVWRIAVFAVTVLSIFKVIFPNMNLAPLFASAGVIGVAVAFGSQTLVKDLLTGIFIVSENQYRVGDIISIGSAEGRVEQIGTRSTVIRDDDGNVHYIPNGSIVHVINKTMLYSKVNFIISLSREEDFEKAIEIIDKIGEDLFNDPVWSNHIIEAPQFKAIENFSKSGIDISIVGKVQPSDQWRVTAELRRRLIAEFNSNNIELG